MHLTLLETSIYVHPGFPVEFAILADGTTLRVAIEWDTIVQLVGTVPAREDQVRQFLHDHQGDIEIAIAAHLAAQGVPLSRRLAMSSRDFAQVQPRTSAGAGDPKRSAGAAAV